MGVSLADGGIKGVRIGGCVGTAVGVRGDRGGVVCGDHGEWRCDYSPSDTGRWGQRHRDRARIYCGLMTTLHPSYKIGQKVRVTQQTPRQSGSLTIAIEGVIVKFEQQKTGSWFAHARDNKLWLDRLELRRDDGEQVVVNLDQYSRVEIIGH